MPRTDEYTIKLRPMDPTGWSVRVWRDDGALIYESDAAIGLKTISALATSAIQRDLG